MASATKLSTLLRRTANELPPTSLVRRFQRSLTKYSGWVEGGVAPRVLDRAQTVTAAGRCLEKGWLH